MFWEVLPNLLFDWLKENIDVNIVRQYVESVLETSGDDFESTDDLYEAIGEVSFLTKLTECKSFGNV